jgi:hypothetical protein
MDIDPLWLVYIPPKVPSIYRGSVEKQIVQAYNYYKSRGMHKIIIEEREPDKSCVIIVCRDKNTSGKYFSGGMVGQLYSLDNNKLSGDRRNNDIIYSIHNDLINSRYFEKYNTDYLIIQAEITENSNILSVIPVKVLAHSYTSYIHKDNIWQIECINRLCSYSDIFTVCKKYVIEDSVISSTQIAGMIKSGGGSFIVKPAKSFPKYKESMMIPEIKCAIKDTLEEEYFNLSNFAYGISMAGLEKFIKNKLPKDYFKYIIGSVAVNNKLQKIG